MILTDAKSSGTSMLAEPRQIFQASPSEVSKTGDRFSSAAGEPTASV